MNHYLSCYRNIQFDGELHARVVLACAACDVTRVVYTLYENGREKEVQTLAGLETATFTGVASARYQVKAKVLHKGGEGELLSSGEIRIAQHEKDRSVRALLQTSPKFSALAAKLLLPPVPCAEKSLKGQLSIDSENRHFLSVMFSQDGLEKLLAERPERVPVFASSRAKLAFRAPANQAQLLRRKGKLGRFARRWANLYSVESALGNLELLALAQELEALDYVEYCSLHRFIHAGSEDVTESPEYTRVDQQEETPDFEHLQFYLDEPSEDAKGLNIRNVWARGITGKAATVHIVELASITADDRPELHEDFPESLQVVGRAPEFIKQVGAHPHALAVVGVAVAQRNGWGVTGVAHDAQAYTYDTEGKAPGHEKIMTQIWENLAPGGVISMSYSLQPSLFGNKLYWDFAHDLALAGGVAVTSAGNTRKNILEELRAAGLDFGDSGGVSVAACDKATGKRAKESCYNDYRILNAQGQDGTIVTTGKGDLWSGTSNPWLEPWRSYTALFGATSAATPELSGCFALLQSYAQEKHAVYLSADDLYTLFLATGYTDAPAQELIGTRPDMVRAIETLDELLK